jgi:hypothetical protein
LEGFRRLSEAAENCQPTSTMGTANPPRTYDETTTYCAGLSTVQACKDGSGCSWGQLDRTIFPTAWPTAAPTVCVAFDSTTCAPTAAPTKAPTEGCGGGDCTTDPTKAPTKAPTKEPTKAPTKRPTEAPTKQPTKAPATAPTTAPPTPSPTDTPTKAPTKAPTTVPMCAVADYVNPATPDFPTMMWPQQQKDVASRGYSSAWTNEVKIGEGHAQGMLNSPQAWSPGQAHENHHSGPRAGSWMQMNLGLPAKNVAGVKVQARATVSDPLAWNYRQQWVTKYKVKLDCPRFEGVGVPAIDLSQAGAIDTSMDLGGTGDLCANMPFVKNSDGSDKEFVSTATTTTQYPGAFGALSEPGTSLALFDSPVVATTVRLYPTDWKNGGSGLPAMRADVVLCTAPTHSTEYPTASPTDAPTTATTTSPGPGFDCSQSQHCNSNQDCANLDYNQYDPSNQGPWTCDVQTNGSGSSGQGDGDCRHHLC